MNTAHTANRIQRLTKRPPSWPHEINHTVSHKERVYVKVDTSFDQTGAMMPKSITWTDGRVFQIEKVEDFRPASTLEPGRVGDCYTVIIKGERKYLFFQRVNTFEKARFGRWWVEVPRS